MRIRQRYIVFCRRCRRFSGDSTMHEGNCLVTYVTAQDLEVVTYLGRTVKVLPVQMRPYTMIWRGRGATQVGTTAHIWPDNPEQKLWRRFYEAPLTAGGLAEAHEHVVAQVKAGRLP